MNLQGVTLVMIPQEEWMGFITTQQEILEQLKQIGSKEPVGVPRKNITAKEFMHAVSIKRTKFDQLVQSNKIRIIKKKRKIYVPVGEVDRYFNDRSIQ